VLLDFCKCFTGLLCENHSWFSLITPDKAVVCSSLKSGLGGYRDAFPLEPTLTSVGGVLGNEQAGRCMFWESKEGLG